MQTYHCSRKQSEEEWWNYNKGRHHGTTNQHFYIYKERIICRSILGWQINSSRTHTSHSTLISLVFYKTPLTKLLRLSSTGATVTVNATGAVTSNSIKGIGNTALARGVTFIVLNHWEKKRREKETSSLEGYFCNHKDQTKIRLAYCIGTSTIIIQALTSASFVCIAGV